MPARTSARRASNVSAKEGNGCPTSVNIVPEADGGLARVHLFGGRLPLDAASRLAEISEDLGSGTIELTNRGNVQLRGIRPGAEAGTTANLVDAGLATSDAWSGTVVLSPLAGLGGDESDESLGVASRIREALAAEDGGAVGAKFAVYVDGGGRYGLRDRSFDIGVGLDATTPGTCRVAIAVPLVAPDEAWRLPLDGVGELTAAVVRACGGLKRARDLNEHTRKGLEERIASLGGAPDPSPAAPPDPGGPIGAWHRTDRSLGHVAAVAELGRLSSEQLLAVVQAARAARSTELRITPWQSLIVPNVTSAAIEGVRADLEAIGLRCDPNDPTSAVVACSGSTGCVAGEADTQADAGAIIDRLRALPRLPDGFTVHVSGCAKRCARRTPSDVTLVGRAGRYDLLSRAELTLASGLDAGRASERIASIASGTDDRTT